MYYIFQYYVCLQIKSFNFIDGDKRQELSRAPKIYK